MVEVHPARFMVITIPDQEKRRWLPYGRQSIDATDVEAAIETLTSDYLTTGPKVPEFERAVADYVGAEEAVAVANGTAALHAAVHAAGIGRDDKVIVPPLTFAATVNAILYERGTPILVDVDEESLLLDPEKVVEAVTPQTKAILAVDYAGQPCEYDALQEIADDHGLRLIADGCHALGAATPEGMVGALADMTVFSFHPVKHITTGEGGMVTTDDPQVARRIRRFRNHGITRDHHEREEKGLWRYDIVDLGYNYRLSDIHCAIGISQLRKLPGWLERRKELAEVYDRELRHIDGVEPVGVRPDVEHAYHLYVVRVQEGKIGMGRDEVFSELRAANMGVNVHYIPVHLQPYYRETLGTGPGLCPVAELAYEQILTLPLFPGMTDEDAADVVHVLKKATRGMRG